MASHREPKRPRITVEGVVEDTVSKSATCELTSAPCGDNHNPDNKTVPAESPVRNEDHSGSGKSMKRKKSLVDSYVRSDSSRGDNDTDIADDTRYNDGIDDKNDSEDSENYDLDADDGSYGSQSDDLADEDGGFDNGTGNGSDGELDIEVEDGSNVEVDEENDVVDSDNDLDKHDVAQNIEASGDATKSTASNRTTSVLFASPTSGGGSATVIPAARSSSETSRQQIPHRISKNILAGQQIRMTDLLTMQSSFEKHGRRLGASASLASSTR